MHKYTHRLSAPAHICQDMRLSVFYVFMWVACALLCMCTCLSIKLWIRFCENVLADHRDAVKFVNMQLIRTDGVCVCSPVVYYRFCTAVHGHFCPSLSEVQQLEVHRHRVNLDAQTHPLGRKYLSYAPQANTHIPQIQTATKRLQCEQLYNHSRYLVRFLCLFLTRAHRQTHTYTRYRESSCTLPLL